MTGNERPDIYADGLREERCENCLHCCATVLRTVHGVERTEYECGRRPEFVHRTQGLPPQRGDAQARGEVQVMATEYVLDADKIAHWRIDNHVPLKQLARAAGVNLSSLSHAISNGREVKMNLLLNLAEAMGEDPRDVVRKKVER